MSINLHEQGMPARVTVKSLCFRYRMPDDEEKPVTQVGSDQLAIDLSLRFLPSVTRDFTATYDAQRARGFEIDKLRGGIFARIARLAPMIVPVIIGSIVDAEDIINAMELRCFGVGKRTWLIQLHPRQVDLFLIIFVLFLFIAITILNILGNFTTLEGIYFLHTQGILRFLVP